MKNLFLLTVIVALIFSCTDEPLDCGSNPNIISNPNDNFSIQTNESFQIEWEICYSKNININLYKGDKFIEQIVSDIINNGVFVWQVGYYPDGNDYKIEISELSGADLISSADFSISFVIPQTTFTEYTEENILVGDKTLQLFTGGEGDVTIIFEYGAGAENGQCGEAEDNFFSNQLLSLLNDSVKFIVYNRSGYSTSSSNGEISSMTNITNDLNAIISQKVNSEKVILIGHSWGGHIIRYFAINYPEKVNALLFIDPDHEDADLNCCLTQSDEDFLVNYCTTNNCEGCALEYAELIETINLMKTIPNLPDIPVRVISGNHGQFGDGWVEAHAKLGEGISDFEQVICECPHEIAKSNPEIVFDQIKDLINIIK